MFALQGRVWLSIKIGGKELDGPNAIKAVYLAEGLGTMIPAFKIVISDLTSTFVSERAIVDGTTVEVYIARSEQDLVKPRKYRVFGQSGVHPGLGPTLVLVGILDSPRYALTSVRKGYKGHSDEVMQQVASECGLTFSGPTVTNGATKNDDYQVWHNIQTSPARFVSYLADYGWMNPTACAAVTCTSYGELRYRDLMAVLNTPVDQINTLFVHNALEAQADGTKQSHLVLEMMDQSYSGVSNASVNYGAERLVPTLTGDGQPQKHEAVDVKHPSGYLLINSEVKQQVNKSRADYAPLDAGNTHPNFQRANYQNIRLRSLFTERIVILVQDVTECQLYDAVIYRQADADPSKPVQASDVYIVTGKTIAVVNGVHYVERITLNRVSVKMKGETNLLSDVTREISQTAEMAITSVSEQAEQAIQAVTTRLQDLIDEANPFSQLVNSIGDLLDSQLRNFGFDISRMLDLGSITDLDSFVAQINSVADTVESITDAVFNHDAALRRIYDQASGDILNTVLDSMHFNVFEDISNNLKQVDFVNTVITVVNETIGDVSQVESAIGRLTGSNFDFADAISSKWNGVIQAVGMVQSAPDFLLHQINKKIQNGVYSIREEILKNGILVDPVSIIRYLRPTSTNLLDMKKSISNQMVHL